MASPGKSGYSKKFLLTDARIVFQPSIFHASTFGIRDGEKPHKYTVKLIISQKDEKNLQKLRAAAAEAVADKWKSSPPDEGDFEPIRDPAEPGKKGKKSLLQKYPDMFEGQFVINANANKFTTRNGVEEENPRPETFVWTPDGAQKTDDPELFYSGAYVHVRLTAMTYETKEGRGVSWRLVSVTRSTKKGERLGNGGGEDEDDLTDELLAEGVELGGEPEPGTADSAALAKLNDLI